MSELKDHIKKLNKNAIGYSNELTIDELVNLLTKFSDAYHNSPNPLVSDEIYDIMFDTLKKRDPKNKFLKKVGAKITEHKNKTKLPYPMPSLDKIKPNTKELLRWFKKYSNKFCVSDKLDGASAELYKDENGELFLYSRGDGIEGRNISHLIKYIFIKSVNLKDLPPKCGIRGELIISKRDYQKYKDQFSNPRNLVVGLTITDKIDVTLAKLVKFVAYAIMEPRLKQSKQFEQLEKWNFDVVTYKKFEIEDNDYEEFTDKLKDYLLKRRKEGEFEIDGLVITDNSKIYELADENPDYSVAFKMLLDDQLAETRVIKVIWEITKHGLLSPSIEIEPVILAGTEIRYVTAKNAKFLVDNSIGVGTIIKIVRSGDVIPNIAEVVKPSKKPQMPDVKYKWNESGVNLILDEHNEKTSTAMGIRRTLHFFKTLGIKHISEGIITKLFDAGYNDLFKILTADKEELTEIEGIGERMIEKIWDQIDEKMSKVSLSTLMASSLKFGLGLGKRKLKEITNEYPDIMKRKYDSKQQLVDDILLIKGFSDLSAEKFADGLQKFKQFYKKISEIYDISHLEKINKKSVKKQSKNQALSGQSIVFTGFRDEDLSNYITNNGGEVANGVSKKTTILLYKGDANTTKIKKAKELGVKPMTKEEFIKLYKITI